jgi:hypothetical protein
MPSFPGASYRLRGPAARANIVGHSAMIPAFLSIDVEPEAFQLDRRDPPAWAGYAAMAEYAESLRARLAARGGTAPRFGWYFRTDPQIAEVHGRPDHAITAFPARIARLQAAGDYFGVHAHPIRWAPESGLWVHEFGDDEWSARAVRFALEAFGAWAGTPPRLFRAGAGFLTNRIVEAAEEAGVRLDLTLEPVTGWGTRARAVPSGVDVSPIVGTYTDCGIAPRLPYRPARHDFRVDGGRQGRPLLMVPVATRPHGPRRPLWRRAARRVLRRPPMVAEVLYPSADWPSPRAFWDMVAEQLRSMRQPYLSLGVRTDAHASAVAGRARRIFDALPEHPLARELRFENPLTTFAGRYPSP